MTTVIRVPLRTCTFCVVSHRDFATGKVPACGRLRGRPGIDNVRRHIANQALQQYPSPRLHEFHLALQFLPVLMHTAN